MMNDIAIYMIELHVYYKNYVILLGIGEQNIAYITADREKLLQALNQSITGKYSMLHLYTCLLGFCAFVSGY